MAHRLQLGLLPRVDVFSRLNSSNNNNIQITVEVMMKVMTMTMVEPWGQQ